MAALVSIRTEGGILPSDVLTRVAALDPTLDDLTPTGYHLLPGERLGESITKSWNRLVGAWAAFQGDTEGSGDRSGRRWLLSLFSELGYGQLQAARPVEIDDHRYPVSHGWANVPIHLVAATASLDGRTPGVAGAARKSPHALVQELLNRSDQRLWGFVSNGVRLRVLRDNAALTRQAFVDFDLEAMFAGQVYADFAVLWLVCHESRVEGDPPEKCVLERWSADAAKHGARALEHLRNGVETAISEIGAGMLAHPANQALRQALHSGALDSQDYYRQLLRLVYRLLFVLVAEARDVLLDPAADLTTRERYLAWYSLDRLRRLAETSRGSPHMDLWRQLRLVFAALGSPTGESALGLPGLGSYLWSDRATPDLDDAELSNRALLIAVRALTSIRDEKEKVRRSVDYLNLGSEELGSVYESLLELHPTLDAATGAFSLSTAGGNERKTTGSYYTPSSLIAELLDSALEPVLDRAARAADPETAILDLTVLDPACGSGHFLIAAAHRMARRLAAVRTGEEEASPTELRRALRDIVGRCLHGIDVNPMAVELCKVSLWMEALEPGKPLSFLDSHVVCGNSILGATPRLLAGGVPDDAFKPLHGDDKAVVTKLRAINKAQRERAQAGHHPLALGSSVADLQSPVAIAMAAVNALPTDTAEQLAEKERRFADAQAHAAVERAGLAADAWCAAFVAIKQPGRPVITDATVRRFADNHAVESEVVDLVRSLRDQYHFLHLHLAFPHIFRVPDEIDLDTTGPGWEGGFDIVLGNPPWEKVKLSEKEFFAVRDPEIAALASGKRKPAIANLQVDDEPLWAALQGALRQADGDSHLLHRSGRYPLCGRGDLNTYAVFAEAMRDSLSPTGGMGVIVPTGIATDDTTKHFFAECVSARSLSSMMSFENEAFIFPGIHHATKFCLLTLTGTDRPAVCAEFFFYARSTADLAIPDRRYSLTPDDLALLNPNTRTAPIFRTQRDAEITKQIYGRLPILIRDTDPKGNLWGVGYQRMFDMANDAKLFHTAAELQAKGAVLDGNIWRSGEQAWLPLYEGKMVFQYDHRYGTYDGQTVAQANQGTLPRPLEKWLKNPIYTVQPRYWVATPQVRSAEHSPNARWLLGFRDITSSVSERTMIPATVPAVACGHKLPLINVSDPKLRALLGAVLCAFCFDFTARQKLGGTSMTFFTFKQLPVLVPETFAIETPWKHDSTVGEWLALRIVELTYTAWDLAEFGADLGWNAPPFRWDPARRQLLRAELDAAFFHLYGLDRDDLDYVMDTFPIVRRRDEANHHEYLTKRLIEERYDAMTASTASGRAYQTVLVPPPADPSLAHPESTRPSWAALPTGPKPLRSPTPTKAAVTSLPARRDPHTRRPPRAA